MVREFQLGCTYNILQADERASPLQLFEMIAAAQAFDYVNWLPPEHLIEDCLVAAERTGLPMLTGNCQNDFAPGHDKLFESIRNASRAGIKLLNVMLHTHAADGHELTIDDVVECYLRASDEAERLGIEVTFELHVDCWSEKYLNVLPVVEAVRRRERKFNFTVDYSHVLFKIENDEELARSDVLSALKTGDLILDPFEPGNILSRWLAENIVCFAQFRPASPNQPRNIWARNPDGTLPRGIMYPFIKPGPGQWHSPWSAWRLAPCKRAFELVLEHHLRDQKSPLQFIITEMIASADYGMNAGFSLLEHNAACARWIRQTWATLKARQAAGLLGESECDG